MKLHSQAITSAQRWIKTADDNSGVFQFQNDPVEKYDYAISITQLSVLISYNFKCIKKFKHTCIYKYSERDSKQKMCYWNFQILIKCFLFHLIYTIK